MSTELYHRQILDWAAQETPEVENPDGTARIDNPLCGDRVDAFVKLSGQTIEAVGFTVRGCRLCEASAALIARQAVSMDLATWNKTAEEFDLMIRKGTAAPECLLEAEAFLPVHDYKSRHDCPILPAQALTAALADAEKTPEDG